MLQAAFRNCVYCTTSCQPVSLLGALIGIDGPAGQRGDLMMLNLSPRCLVTCVTLLMGVAQGASAAEILISDAKSQPESLTVAPGGVLIVGSASTPFVYKVRPGSTTAEKFIDASAEGAGTFFSEY